MLYVYQVQKSEEARRLHKHDPAVRRSARDLKRVHHTLAPGAAEVLCGAMIQE